MKNITNTKITRKIVIAIIIIILYNFIFPSFIMADDDEDGGSLFNPISELFCGLGDLVIMGLQKIFLGYAQLEDDAGYKIYYGPENIFSGKIPTFDINFINPDATTRRLEVSHAQGFNTISTQFNRKVEEGKAIILRSHPYTNAIATRNGLISHYKECTRMFEVADADDNLDYEPYAASTDVMAEITGKFNDSVAETVGTITTGFSGKIESAWRSQSNDYIYVIFDDEIVTTNSIGATGGTVQTTASIVLYRFNTLEDVNAATNAANADERIETTESIELDTQSSASILQGVISTWYKALRTIALAGLLSVLIYIGIRIVLSSTGENKAKYKKMLIDWFVAICILFVLQFLMVFIIEITNRVTDIIAGNSSNGIIAEDNLMSGIRNRVASDPSFKTSLAEMVIYLVLVIYTCIFTVVYLKRVAYIAFLTMISPLIALTYPLDKIKDGQAQAFSMWLKEYIFNSLLQVIHILLYTILITSSQALINSGNYIYAIVAIGFLKTAEKFFRKMFGFEKAGTISPFGAAAGGAVAMNAINKMKAKAGGGGSNSADSQGNDKVKTNERTAGGENKTDSSTSEWAKNSNKPLEDNQNFQEQQKNANEQEEKQTREQDSQYEREEKEERTQSEREEREETKQVEEQAKVQNQQQQSNNRSQDLNPEQSKIGKAKAWGREHIVDPYNNNKTIKGIRAITNGRFTGKNILKALAKKSLQVAIGATFGTVGLAAGIATGDFSKAGKFALSGAVAGGAVAKGISNKVSSGWKTAKADYNIFRQGYEGTDYEQKENERLDKEFMSNPENKRFFNTKFANGKQAMDDALILRQNNVKDKEDIAKLLKMAYDENPNANNEQRVENVKKMANIAQLSESISESGLNNSKRRKEFKEAIKKKLMEQGVEEQLATSKTEKMFKLIAKYKKNDLYQ